MRYVYVDGENVSFSNFSKLFTTLKPTDKLLIFHSTTNIRVSYATLPKLIKCNVDVEFISVQSGKKNALDFVLASYVGSYAFQSVNAEHYILSNDLGYEALCKHFSSLGIFVERVPDVYYITG